jgi:TolA-binding protein
LLYIPAVFPRLAAALILAAVTTAPFQCASDPDPKKATEEGPGEALYGLATRFHEQGDEKARAETLRFIVARYPSSRFAVMARDDLDKIGSAGAPPR